MTIRELDETIEAALASGPKQATVIHAATKGACSLYDVCAALRIWERNGWAHQEEFDGRWVKVACTFGLPDAW